ncbi:hypothetical protein V6N12_007984 [Hibiscus sabdariffa]|uniref:Cystathionine beta-lyase n=1 Tax=Hibiscus sabdariffa TaxID=183260 RepID=A0ABR2BSJ7_9ROSI
MTTPLYQTATFKQPSATENGPYDYTRSGNPTRDTLERQVNTSDLDEVAAVIGPKTKLVWLESPTNPQLQIADIRRISEIAHANGARVGRQQYYVTSIVTTVGTWSSWLRLWLLFLILYFEAFSDGKWPYDYTRSGNPRRDTLESGMAALSAVANLVGSGQEIVAGDDIYGGSDRLLSRVTPKSGVLVKRVNTSDLDEVAAVIGPKTKLVGLESPTNPQLQIADIRRVSAIAHANGARVGRRQYYVTSIVTTVGTWSRIQSTVWGQWNMDSSASVTADYITGSVKALISLPCFMSHASIPSAVRDARGLTEDLVRI